MSEYDIDADREFCRICGGDTEVVQCDLCAGEGMVDHDCGDDTCPCLNPQDNVSCDACDGVGHWSRCVNSREWCESHPIEGSSARSPA